MATRKSTASTSSDQTVSDILEVQTGRFDCHILGTSGIILNRMSEKAKHELLLPRGKKTAIEKALSLKHMPIDEFRASAYTVKNPHAPTLLAILATSFKGALRTAALDMPGAKKAQIGRLTYVDGEYVGIYGVPKLKMDVVRSADMNRTPDIRTRAIVPQWACKVTISFVQPLIRAKAVANLLAAAGLTVGVGDWRPEKGSGNYGQFRIVDKDDPEFVEIVKTGGRAAQQEALDHPVAYDDETTEMLSWYADERASRQLKGVA